MIILMCSASKFKLADKKDFVKSKNSAEKKMNTRGSRIFFRGERRGEGVKVIFILARGSEAYLR